MSHAADLARRLSHKAEAVCLFYLPQGRRHGNYWHCGDVQGTPGQSLYVHLTGSHAGKWTDAATGEHGDLLDLISLNQGLDLRGALIEAEQFLCAPRPPARPAHLPVSSCPSEAARRLFSASRSIHGTLAETWLRSRGLVLPSDIAALRFHPHCYYGAPSGREIWPALIAAVTDTQGCITGVHRTWLDPSGGKAPVDQPRRAMGHLLGNGVRFGVASDVIAATEGIETALTLKTVMPDMPVIAALSASHLSALILPPALRCLYVAHDNDKAGHLALERLRERFQKSAVDIRALGPRSEDFNADLLTLGADPLQEWLAAQLAQNDRRHFLPFDGWQEE